ncbi:Type III secretion bridge between inner and outermembrane lipoprotein (YscJ,HrcJ,EscJ, PscJ) [plant metagenome]|uniref:Type III secretion bridge between inner and outermembrane lipoprotein (YscJ,HrcJ,EscJ, PscJ) n=1 Tax=plant metagenome TaxID=1297885 RepID=A0A484XVX3_9ZZZZ
MMTPALLRRARACVLAPACVLLLAACSDQTLYSNLSERDSNEVVAALLEAGIPARKESPDGGKSWSAVVKRDAMVQAMEVLRVRGLPERSYDNLGELFKKDGFVSTPVQERVRFIYGSEQQLSETLSRIDGVILARVHIVLPNNDPLATSVRPSSASVFIKYRSDANLDALTPQIKNMVVHSVEGLSYDQVSLTLVQADPLVMPAQARASEPDRNLLVGAALGLFLLGASAIALALRRHAAGWPEALGGLFGRSRREGKAVAANTNE